MTRQQAINAFCKGCLYDQHDSGTWRDQITNCTAPSCPLYEYRPLNKAKADEKRDKKIQAMSDMEKQKYYETAAKKATNLHNRKN